MREDTDITSQPGPVEGHVQLGAWILDISNMTKDRSSELQI